MADWRSKFDSNGGGPTGLAPANQGAFTNAIQKTGAYDIPVLGGILRGIGQPLANIAEVGAEDVRAAGQRISGQIGPGKAPYQPAFMSPESQQALLSPEKIASVKQNPLNAVGNAAKYEATQLPSQAGAILSAQGLSGVPSLVKSLPTLTKLLVTPGKAISSSVEKATTQGASHTASDVLTEIRQAVEQKLGSINSDKELARAYGIILKKVTGSTDSPETIAKLSAESFSGKFSPADLVKLRQELPARFKYVPTGEGTVQQSVANIARDVLSKRAKEITPGLAQADKAYQFRKLLEDKGPNLLKALGTGGGIIGAGAIGAGVYNTVNRE